LLINDIGEEAISMNHRLHSQRIRRNQIPSPQTKRMYSSLVYLFFEIELI
jgi:hypothetical protein